ncbi:conserved hypothetical protein [Talaromyces stipitatus ATCC 10500]|uniref:Uncharacterized protein n=1 Tax=Talaromyces stipitatus (strain ATCC 10500 / CBS 375.48 / QM 6759 / NRRL 1006) TaxID=441959 RepID=B8M9E6_TALSN|nr:uncharacterized protein TSTA_115060 [Talaromyces stipitatus ATCC 10500]EED17706.1 conserved hypothetical protein [Talaromyces stipitatus ATCC 10500]
MDSMRSLNTSLPSSTSHAQPPEQLLQAFKAAALSVTNLYKSAVTDQAQAKQLDRKHLGLGDGEGWQVRQWATERLDGVPSNSESEDDDKPARSSSPVVYRKEHHDNDQLRHNPEPTQPRTEDATTDEQRPQQTEPVQPTDSADTTFTKPPVFTFSAGPTFPVFSQDVDMQSSDTSSMTSTSQDEPTGVGISMLPRNTRTAGRLNVSARRSPTHGTSVGNKRKLQFPDFFDLSGLNGREFFGGGKRGRFT